MNGWSEAMKLAASSRPAAGVRTVTVNIATRDRIAFLTSADAVDRAVRAIEGAIKATSGKS
jgi:hypothetical protein